MANGDDATNLQPPPDQSGAAQPLPSPGDLHWGDWERMPQNQQAQKPFEPYRAILPARHSSQLGQPDFILDGARKLPGLAPGPFMPQAQDVPNVLQSLFGGLGRTGSPQVRSLILAAAASHSGWLNSYLKGWEMRQKMLHQQFSDNLEQAQEAQRKESEEYAVAFAKYPDGSQQQREAVRAVALRQHPPDKDMLDALNGSDPAAPHRLQQVRDGYWLSGEKYRSQTSKTREEERREKARETLGPWMDQPDSGATAPPSEDTTTPETIPPSSAPGAPAAPTVPGETPEIQPPTLDWGTTGQAAPSTRTALAAAAQPPAAPSEPQPQPSPEEAPPYRTAGLDWVPPPQQQQLAQAAPLPSAVPRTTSPVLDAARQAQFPDLPGQHLDANAINQLAEKLLLKTIDRTQLTKLPLPVIQWATRREAEMEQQLDRITNSSLKDREQILRAVRDVSPQMASGIAGVVDGARAPPTGARLDQLPWNKAFNLARKIDSTINENTFRTRARAMANATIGGTFGRQAQYISAAVNQINQTLEAIDNQPAWWAEILSRSKPGEAITERFAPGASERTSYTESMIMDAIAETEKAVTNGKPTQTERLQQEMKSDILYKGPKAVRGQIEGRLNTLRNTLAEMRRDYERETGRSGENMFAGNLDAEILRNLQQVQTYKAPGASRPSPAPTTKPPLKPGWSLR